eukprot:4683081-Pyramimonas_sp.AAC.1
MADGALPRRSIKQVSAKDKVEAHAAAREILRCIADLVELQAALLELAQNGLQRCVDQTARRPCHDRVVDIRKANQLARAKSGAGGSLRCDPDVVGRGGQRPGDANALLLMYSTLLNSAPAQL